MTHSSPLFFFWILNMKVLHISFNGKLPKVLVPRQPDGSDGEITKYSEQLPNRVSFAPTIQQCILGIYPNISHYFEDPEYNYPYMDFFVYGATITKNTKIIDPDTLKKGLIDYYVTEEVAVLEPIAIELVGKVRFNNQEPNVDEVWFYPWADRREKPLYAGPRADYDVTVRYVRGYDLTREMPWSNLATAPKPKPKGAKSNIIRW